MAAAVASPVVSVTEVAAMQAEALGGAAFEKTHGRFEFMLEDPDLAVDATTGRGSADPSDDCANTPIRTKRSDGSTVIVRVDICD